MRCISYLPRRESERGDFQGRPTAKRAMDSFQGSPVRTGLTSSAYGLKSKKKRKKAGRVHSYHNTYTLPAHCMSSFYVSIEQITHRLSGTCCPLDVPIAKGFAATIDFITLLLNRNLPQSPRQRWSPPPQNQRIHQSRPSPCRRRITSSVKRLWFRVASNFKIYCASMVISR